MATMGGEERLRAMRSIRLEGSGHRNELEQSERAEGPWLINYFQFDERCDFEKNKLRRSSKLRTVARLDSYENDIIVSSGVVAEMHGDRLTPGDLEQKEESESRMALGPERLLVHALDAKDLADGENLVMQGVPHHVVRFSWRGVPIRVYFNGETGLPTAVEWVSQHSDTFWGVWGDVTTRVLYSAWNVFPGGLRFPMQWDTERNGLPAGALMIGRITIDPELPATTFAIPDDVAKARPVLRWSVLEGRSLPSPQRPPVVIDDGIIEFLDDWNVTLVRQNDGIVVLEAPIASSFSAQVLAEARRRFPGLPVKAVVSTSDSWPHIGGLREYVAEGIPIYVLDRNRPILERLLSAPHRIAPDKLAKHPQMPKWHFISHAEQIGDDANRLTIYPYRTEGAERMMMVDIPERHLLYTGDLVQPLSPEGTSWFPGYLLETAEAVAREKLVVDRVFGMHIGPTPWSTIGSAIDKARAPAALSGAR